MDRVCPAAGRGAGTGRPGVTNGTDGVPAHHAAANPAIAAREASADGLPYEAGNLERLLAQLENEQTIENLFDVPSPSSGGFYLMLGNITTGAGLTLGTGYSGRTILGRQLELSVRGAV